MQAVENTSFESLKLLMENGASIGIKDKFGVEAREMAKIKDHLPILQFLEQYPQGEVKLMRFLYYPRNLLELKRARNILTDFEK